MKSAIALFNLQEEEKRENTITIRKYRKDDHHHTMCPNSTIYKYHCSHKRTYTPAHKCRTSFSRIKFANDNDGGYPSQSNAILKVAFIFLLSHLTAPIKITLFRPVSKFSVNHVGLDES